MAELIVMEITWDVVTIGRVGSFLQDWQAVIIAAAKNKYRKIFITLVFACSVNQRYNLKIFIHTIFYNLFMMRVIRYI